MQVNGEIKFCATCPRKNRYNGSVTEANVVVNSRLVPSWGSEDGTISKPEHYLSQVLLEDDLGCRSDVVDSTFKYDDAQRIYVPFETDADLPIEEQYEQACGFVEKLDKAEVKRQFVGRIAICDGSAGHVCPAMENIGVLAYREITKD